MKKINTACIIDDDDIAIWGIKKLMEYANFCENILVFKNGLEALNKLKPMIENGVDVPEIILLDLNMPIMDGWGFLEEFIQIKTEKQIKIYIVSSSIDPEDYKKAKSYSEVSNFLVKPLKTEHLKGILEEIN
ncbi:MAG: response regulator [Cytophagales bacterium]